MIKGLIAPILTPFSSDTKVDQELYNKLALHLLANGCSGLAPFGTTGEALSVGNQERMDALDGLVDAGIDASVLIPGTGLCNIADTTTLCQHAMDLGCAGVMTLPPFYFKGMSDEGLFDYYASLIQEIDRPNLKIYLYHIPQVSGVGLSIDLVQRLHNSFPEVIVGIKDSSGNWENTQKLLAIEGLIVYPGSELPIIDAIKLGAPGCISATANLNPTNIGKVIDLCHSGQWEEAESLHQTVRAVRVLFQDYAPIPAQKAILAKSTGEANWAKLRPPFRPMSDEKRDQLLSDLAPHGFSV